VRFWTVCVSRSWGGISRRGDLVLQVNYTSSIPPSEDDVKEKALALMGALLAP
jgi:hypothetical protein